VFAVRVRWLFGALLQITAGVSAHVYVLCTRARPAACCMFPGVMFYLRALRLALARPRSSAW